MQNELSKSLPAFKTLILGWGMVFFFVVFNSFGAFTIKNQIQKVGPWNFSSPQLIFSFFVKLFSFWQTWVGLASISVATLAWILALAHLEMSKAYPVAIGVNLLVLVSISLFYFHEPLTFSKMLGIFFMFTGIIFLFR